MHEVKFGTLCWNQTTDWPDLLEAGVRADQLGYDTLWTWDPLQSSIGPVFGDRTGPGCTASSSAGTIGP